MHLKQEVIHYKRDYTMKESGKLLKGKLPYAFFFPLECENKSIIITSSFPEI